MAIQGSCLCGTVRYEISAPFTAMLSCHCSMCRKHHGAPFATYANTALSGFRWTSGEPTLGHYAASPNYSRSFCTTCGAVAPSLMPDADLAFVPAGTLDGDEDEERHHQRHPKEERGLEGPLRIVYTTHASGLIFDQGAGSRRSSAPSSSSVSK